MVSFLMSRLIFVAALCVLGTFAVRKCNECPIGWKSFNLRCYKHFGSQMKDWAEAEKYCVAQRGNLASVHSAIEYKFLQKLSQRSYPRVQHPFWIGLSDCLKERTWFWSDGSAMDFQSWNSRKPNRNSNNNDDCVISSTTGAKRFDDVNCNRRFRFICSKPQDNDFW